MVMVSDAWRVRCLNCNTEGRMSVIDHSAIIYWNTRPIEDTLNKRIAELETIVDTAVGHMRRLLPEYEGIDVDSLSHDRYAKVRKFISEWECEK